MYYRNHIYKEDLSYVLDSNRELQELNGCTILITGASGLICSFLVDVLMLCNELSSCKIDVFALSRNASSLAKRFESHGSNPHFHILQHDVSFPLNNTHGFDYVIHGASNAYPRVFATDPVGTIAANIWGVQNLLEHQRENGGKRLLFISSGEVYGQGSDGVNAFDESFGGYVDSTDPRACYPNAKRLAETLCVSYTKQYGIDTVIARPCHTYGPTATSNDDRVSAQFISNVLDDKDIILKSPGLQLRSYCYVADCVSGILTILLKGISGNAYNIAHKGSTLTIRDMAKITAEVSGRRVAFDVPNDLERSGYNPVTKSVLNADKLEKLGWIGKYDMKQGITRTISILKSTRKHN